MSDKKTYSTHEFLEAFKKNSHLYKFYEYFNIDIDDSYHYYKTCNYTAKVGSNNRCYTSKQITQKWKEKFDHFSLDDENVTDPCYLLVLWIYDRIQGCGSNNYCISWYYGLLENFWHESSCCEKYTVEETKKVMCKNKFIKTFKLDALKNKRELYDFLEYFNNISTMPTDKNSGKKKEYCKYVSDIFQLYKEIIKKSCSVNYEYEIEKFKEHVINKVEHITILQNNCPNLFQDISFIKNNLTKCLSKDSSEKNAGSHHLSTHSDTDNIESHILVRSSIISSDHENLLKEIIVNDNSNDSYFYKKYENLDKTADKDSTVNTKFESIKSDYNEISDDILKKLIKNIILLKNIKNANDYRESCLYYKYWTYEKMWITLKNKSELKVEDVINKFLDLHKKLTSEYNNEYKCEFHFYVKNLDQLEYLLEQRHLDIYFKIFPIIKSNINCTMYKKEKYLNYLKYIIPLYKIHKEDCCLYYNIWGDYTCHNYFKCHNKYNPDNLLNALNYVGNNDCNNFLKPLEPKISDNSDNSQNYNSDNDASDINIKCHRGFYRYNNQLYYSYICTDKEGDKGNSSARSPHNSSYMNIIFNGSFLILGILFLLFLFCKFTPLGSMLQKKRNKSENIKHDIHEQQRGSVSWNNSDTQNINSPKKRIQIAYHSS